MNSRKLIAGALTIAVPLTLAIVFRPDRAIRVATGLVAHNVCSKSFVSGLDPDTVFAETTDRAGLRLLRWGLNTGSIAPPNRRCFAGRAARQPRHISRRTRLRPRARFPASPISQERHRSVEDAESPAAAAGDRRSRRGRTVRSHAESRARSCLRGAGRAAVPHEPRQSSWCMRQGDRRTLRRRDRRRYAAARLLHDQIRGQRADRHSDPTGQSSRRRCRRRYRNGAAPPIRAARSRSSI